MGRILAIDYGRKRVGLAVSDPQQIIANKLATVATHTIWDFLQTYFKNEKVDEVVIGYPLQMNNTASEAVVYINPFIKKFKQKYPEIPLEMADERFTSKLAFQTMIDGGVKKAGRRNKAMVDAISATIILQSYMEQKRNRM
ncbi:putative holliday junction resolvase [Mariniphaga anaerophila]|uniref:Putative pre-16S rRNA nuclease n=1 Tax=Mariniphaga anaerophila TaxID=1484053 RepID=A0A1M4VWL9_9BACT|nr:Holliday junction resolvase RuvX [Mariniphaga anaerophila]SHE73401.1 putative holliday junction resolvase [Mariniphaga anaerophila]